MPSDPRPLQMTIAQVAAEFGGRSAQWLRRQIASNPAFKDFPQPDRRTGFYRTAQIVAWCDGAVLPQDEQPRPRARRAPVSADDWTEELSRRPV